jgi:hypothetical protein
MSRADKPHTFSGPEHNLRFTEKNYNKDTDTDIYSLKF